MPRVPNFLEEKKLWKEGYQFVIGVDEVGRGAFAGPVTAAAVCFYSSFRSGIEKETIPDRRDRGLEMYLRKIGVNDSKVLRPRKRVGLAREIKKLAFKFAVASASVGEINRLGIKKATERAFRRAINTIRDRLKIFDPGSNIFVLSDAFHIKNLKGIGLKNQKAIKKGDKKSFSIAAASIIAKVHRDRLMKKLSCRHPKYRWEKNKGYGTLEHRKAILRYGLTRLHRKKFVEKTLNSANLFPDRHICFDPGSE